MLIESLIKRPNAPINLGGRDYFFRPLDNNPQSPHVCEVTEIAHCDRLLSITEGYRAYELPTVQRAPAPEAPPSQPPATGALTDEQRERVSALLGSSVNDLRAAVPSIEDLAVLTALLDTEAARTSPPPRTTVLTLVSDRIAKLTQSA